MMMTAAGAFLLYPIGTAIANQIFVLIKIGMGSGLILLLFLRKKAGFPVWVSFSVGAVIMTLIKWHIMGKVSLLIIGSVAVDILMPVVAYVLMRFNENDGRP